MELLFAPVELRPYQLEILQAVTDSVYARRGLTFSVEIARQGGKNELSAWLEMQLLLSLHDCPLNIVKCAPTFRPQAAISLRRLCDRLNDSGMAGRYDVEDGHIVRLNRARVVFLSAEPGASVVGNTAHLLLELDEAQDIDIDKFNRDFKPMAAVANATTVLYGTPWHDNTLLEAVKQSNLALERTDGIRRHFSYDWQQVAAFNPDYRTYVEGEMSRLGEDHPVFRTQYALLPLRRGGGFLSDEQLLLIEGRHPRRRSPETGKTYVGGLDLGGEGSGAVDQTVLTIAEVSVSDADDPAAAVVQHYAWTGLSFTALIPRVAGIARDWGLRRLAVDATGMGQPLAAMLRQSLGSRVVSVVFTSGSKSAAGYNFLAAVNTGKLRLYHDNSAESQECRRQLENASADYRANQLLNFYVDPARGHDDYLISLVLTRHAAARYRPRAAVGYRDLSTV
ncbi:hypothetical protein DGWBC_0207 [Dehalogenimonas sp. WBC-2]|nr:hypothetical protein DGWBC_0207 [Dehalogenimonas sp. WBC-2]